MSINYAAIIMDIRHSRKYDEEQRFFIQDKLFSIIQFINKYYNKELVKKFEFSSGDSIQALFMLGVFANYHDFALALNDFALLAHGLHGRSDFHC